MNGREIYIVVVEVVENILIVCFIEICVVFDYVGFDFGVDVFEMDIGNVVYVLFYKGYWIKFCIGMVICVEIDF